MPLCLSIAEGREAMLSLGLRRVVKFDKVMVIGGCDGDDNDDGLRW